MIINTIYILIFSIFSFLIFTIIKAIRTGIDEKHKKKK